MIRNRLKIRNILGLALPSAVLAGALALGPAAPVDAQPGSRLCYNDNTFGGGTVYLERSRSTDCSAISWPFPGTKIKYKDVPNLYREGALRDMSICENFTRYMMDLPESLRDGDVCDEMKRGEYATMSVLRGRMGI